MVSYPLEGRVLNRFSKDVGFLDDHLPYYFCEYLMVSVGISDIKTMLYPSRYFVALHKCPIDVKKIEFALLYLFSPLHIAAPEVPSHLCISFSS